MFFLVLADMILLDCVYLAEHKSRNNSDFGKVLYLLESRNDIDSLMYTLLLCEMI